jgi:hypothetical protein
MSLQSSTIKNMRTRSGLALGMIIIIALVAFEVFNYSTTEYALSDLLGPLTFANIPWSTILSIAFCGIDFAGIARLFSPDEQSAEPKEVWYLFGAWLIAATMNAILTWWGVSMAIVDHTVRSTAIVSGSTIIKVVPIFVAVMVWVIRILIIGTISVSIDRYMKGDRHSWNSRSQLQNFQTAHQLSNSGPVTNRYQPMTRSFQTRPDRDEDIEESTSRPEPSYHSVGVSARPAAGRTQVNEPDGHKSRMG